MQMIVPMAGLGRRFQDAGYRLPKPLIPVGNAPMFVRAIEGLPPAETIAFIVNPEHVRDFDIDAIIRRRDPLSRIVVAPGMTEGQASSVALAEASLDPGKDVCVTACDNTHLYSASDWRRVVTDESTACAVWTYRGEPRVLARPESYGWVATDETMRVTSVSVKKPFGERVLHDHVISGTFWFRSAGLLFDSIRELVSENQRVNGEFYLDSIISILMRNGYKVRVFEVEKYIGWGTPEDLRDYEKWMKYFRGIAAIGSDEPSGGLSASLGLLHGVARDLHGN